MGVTIIKTGATRWVILWKNWAIKIPSFYSYRNFLQGILGNEQERHWFKEMGHTGKLCPVSWTFPGCFVLVMKRARLLTEDEARSKIGLPSSLSDFIKIDENCSLPVELKTDSFGWLDGKLVAIDYGS